MDVVRATDNQSFPADDRSIGNELVTKFLNRGGIEWTRAEHLKESNDDVPYRLFSEVRVGKGSVVEKHGLCTNAIHFRPTAGSPRVGRRFGRSFNDSLQLGLAVARELELDWHVNSYLSKCLYLHGVVWASIAIVFHLVQGVKAEDVKQGAVGDCWLVAAMATLASTMPGAIRKLFLNKERSWRCV